MWWYLPWKTALPVSMKEDHSSRIRDRPLFRSRIHKRPCFQDPWKTSLLWSIKDHSFMICEDHCSRTFRVPIFTPVSMKGHLFMTHRSPLFHDSWKPIPPWSTKDPSLRILKSHPSRIQETALVPGSRKHHSPRIQEGPLCQDAGRTRIQEGPFYRLQEGPLSGCRIDHSTRMQEGPPCQDPGRTALVKMQKGPFYQDAGRTTLPGSSKDHSTRLQEGPLYQAPGRTTLPGSWKDHSTRLQEGPLYQAPGRTTLPGSRKDQSTRLQEGPLYQAPGRTNLPGSRKDLSTRVQEGPLYQDSWKSAFPQSIKTTFILPGFRGLSQVVGVQTTDNMAFSPSPAVWPILALFVDWFADFLKLLKYLMLCFSLL